MKYQKPIKIVKGKSKYNLSTYLHTYIDKYKINNIMAGRNINIYLNENLHQQLVPLIKERKVSKFINEAIEEKLSQEKQQEIKRIL